MICISSEEGNKKPSFNNYWLEKSTILGTSFYSPEEGEESD